MKSSLCFTLPLLKSSLCFTLPLQSPYRTSWKTPRRRKTASTHQTLPLLKSSLCFTLPLLKSISWQRTVHIMCGYACILAVLGQRGRVVSASDSGSGGRGFDSRSSHVVIALGKQFTLTFPSPPTCKMGTQLQAMSL